MCIVISKLAENILHIELLCVLLDYLWWPVLYRNYSAFPSAGCCCFSLWQQTTPPQSRSLTNQLEPSSEHPSHCHPVDLQSFASGLVALKWEVCRHGIYNKNKCLIWEVEYSDFSISSKLFTHLVLFQGLGESMQKSTETVLVEHWNNTSLKHWCHDPWRNLSETIPVSEAPRSHIRASGEVPAELEAVKAQDHRPAGRSRLQDVFVWCKSLQLP